MPPRFACLKLLALSLLCGGAWALGADPESSPAQLDQQIKPLLEKYCVDCHNAEKTKGDVNLVDIMKNPRFAENRDTWAKVLDEMESGEMPPEKKPKPDEQQRTLVLHFLGSQLTRIDASRPKNPGRVTLRRLNREEYKNTVRDLLKVDFYPEDFPNDEVGYGFDNIADVLSLSPMLMEKYLAAAEEISKKAIIAGPQKPIVKAYKGKDLVTQNKNAAAPNQDGTMSYSGNAVAERMLDFPTDGEYTIRIRASGDQAGPEPVRLGVSIDGKQIQMVSVPAFPKKPESYELKGAVAHGTHKFGIAFLNDYYDETNQDPKLRGDRNLYVESFELQYPPGEGSLPGSHKQLITKMPTPGQEKAVARELIRPFLERAYRRPVTEAEVERIGSFVDLALKNQGSFLEGMQVAVQAVLCSPQFLFRWELDPGRAQPGEVRDLNDFEVASRLSYFLWSSMPDEQLFTLAKKGELLKGDNLPKQVTRMLADWKARALVNGFGDQWLQIRNIFEIAPDPKLFPRWSDDLRGMMKEETERFVEAIIKEDRSVLDLIDGHFTFLNEKLAAFYGIPGVKGAAFQRVELPANSPRGGVLTQGAVLMATSTPTRTSPVIRGKWILEQILGSPPPAPPPDVPPLNEQSSVNQSASLRERFTAHSKRAECAACHTRMDPLGYALENFDATGGWRDKDGKFNIDARGTLPDGRDFDGAPGLKKVLKSGDKFIATLSEKLMTYALGRGTDLNDRPALKTVLEATKKGDDKFSALVTAIVTSDPFLKRKTADALTSN